MEQDKDEGEYVIDEENTRIIMRKGRLSQKLAEEEEKKEGEAIWNERKTSRIRMTGRSAQAHKNRRNRCTG